MAYTDLMIVELQRRAALLPATLASWRSTVEQNIAGFGIHRSQVLALKTMMDELEQRQTELLAQLSPNLTPAQFADLSLRLDREIVGSHMLWRIFRHIMAQWRDEQIAALVDAADLIAADCYLTCTRQAEIWGLMTPQEFREPPLVYLEAEDSPATASRGRRASLLEPGLNREHDQILPIPVVQLPYHHADSIWLFGTLHHEVGHNLDQDIRLRAAATGEPDLTLTVELKQKLNDRLERAAVDLDRRRVWQRWTSEMLADAFAVLLGGAGAASTLVDLLLVRAPLNATVVTGQAHPDHWVRIALIAALLRQLNVQALTEAADAIIDDWTPRTKPAAVADYSEAVDLVAAMLLDEPLQVLGGKRLRDFVPNLAAEADQVKNLARYLEVGFGQPDAKTIPSRLVPPAAQIAVRSLRSPDAAALALIQERALKYLRAIPRPQFLGGTSPETSARRRTRALNFDHGFEDEAVDE